MIIIDSRHVSITVAIYAIRKKIDFLILKTYIGGQVARANIKILLTSI
ncbi:hypothetical protein [[Eubacterium] cellulosolvens]